MPPTKLQPGEPSETIAAYVAALIEKSPAMPVIDLVSFSGLPTDVIFDVDAIYLRVKSHRARDQDGHAYEIWGRLTAAGGLWSIPDEPTEMLLIAAPHTDGVAGTAWLLHTAQLPAGIQIGNISNGRAVLASPKGGSAILFGDDDSIALKVTDKSSDQDVMFVLNTDGTGIRSLTPWGRSSLGSRGFHVLIPGSVLSAPARLDLGNYGGSGIPVPGLGSYARMTADSTTVGGKTTKLGRSPYFSVALSATPGPFGVAGFGSFTLAGGS